MKEEIAEAAHFPRRLSSVYASSISSLQGPAYDRFRFEKGISTFSRFNWSVASGTRGRETDKELLVHVPVKTLISIGVKEPTPIPPRQPIPKDVLVGTLEIEFAVEYLVTGLTLDAVQKKDMNLVVTNEILLRDLWPYWQEYANNLAMRSRLPQSRFLTYEMAAGLAEALPKSTAPAKRARKKTPIKT